MQLKRSRMDCHVREVSAVGDNPFVFRCNGANVRRRPESWAHAPICDLRTSGASGNVKLAISDITDAMAERLPEAVVDLVEIAALVYVADQMAIRTGTVKFDYADRWRRRFRFEVAVREVDFWEQEKVRQSLERTLSFLSDDHYEFVFTARRDPAMFSEYLDMKSRAASAEVDTVMLFSGGLDSLAGAVDEILVEKKRTVLVSHRPVKHLATRQRELVTELVSLQKGSRQKPWQVPVSVHKIGEYDREEFTQRSRSFLYASIAAAVAHSLKIDRIRFYENGIVSINLPLCGQELGGRATRTTHPKVLDGFGELFSLVLNRKFRVDNPYLWLTKQDVVQRLNEVGYPELCGQSISCTHTRMTTSSQSHCGICSQCISRRAATLGAGLELVDRGDGYRTDVFIGERKKPEDRILAERFLGTAQKVESMAGVGEFQAEFAGELSRVYKHVEPSTELAAAKLFDLHRRHAEQVGAVVDQLILRHGRDHRLGNLPDTCALEFVFGRTLNAVLPDWPTEVGKIEETTAESAQEKTVQPGFTPRIEEVRILKILHEHGQTMKRNALAAAIDKDGEPISDRSLGRYLMRLRTAGAVHLPNGSRSGVAISDAGVQLIKTIQKTNSRKSMS